MTVIKLATSVWHNSTLPRDAVMINPVMDVHTVVDAQSLVDNWMTAFKSWSGMSTTSQITIKAYDVEHAEPNPPMYERTDNPGVAAGVSSPREIAVCLSFFAGANVKRHRGRLFVPFFWLFATAALSDRPSQTVRDKVGALSGVLAALGGANVDWVVWSGVDRVARKVSDWYVDDEWDTQRRRGLRPTARSSGSTSG